MFPFAGNAPAQFQDGINKLALLPDTSQRQRQELKFCIAMGAVFRAVKGHAAAETGQSYDRARELWKQLGSPSEFLQVPYGLARYYAHQGAIDLALRLDEDLLRLSRQRNDNAGLALGHSSSGLDLMFAGRFAFIPIASGGVTCAI
ncbi:MAG: hypothetical protein JOY83_08645 [Alphaproteobacteria bacterium]|nr:hypothetical protein [Alphaproteobacteria bacterium]